MQCVTWASNANTHPGMIQHGNPHQTTQEVQAKWELEAAAKASATTKKKAKMQAVAEIEAMSQKAIKEKDHQANNPDDKTMAPRGKRPRAPWEYMSSLYEE